MSADDMDTRRSARFIASMWKYALAAVVGFLITVLTLAVSREVYFAFQAWPAAELIGSSLSAIGSLRWVDTTLVTGATAAAAVIWQIRQAAQFEKDRFFARRASARAVLPLALSEISHYSEEVAQGLRLILNQMSGKFLPTSAKLPEFPELPDEAIANLRAMVDASLKEERQFLFSLLTAIQVLRSRLRALPNDHAKRSWIFSSNIDAYLINAADVYARSAALFEFGRGHTDVLPQSISRSEVRTALFGLGIFDELRDKLTERYNLTSEQIFPAMGSDN